MSIDLPVTFILGYGQNGSEEIFSGPIRGIISHVKTIDERYAVRILLVPGDSDSILAVQCYDASAIRIEEGLGIRVGISAVVTGLYYPKCLLTATVRTDDCHAHGRKS